ncbi:MAG TPA: DUF512 domain-containing protein [Acidimicrobiia bacterium]
MTTTRIVAVAPDSPAAAAGILVGDELLALNGERLRDVIRYQIQAEEPEVDVELRRGGVERSVVIRKPAGAPLGLELDAAVFDRVRTCDNHCPFCFIYQLPEGMRRSLYVKDDDYRLSFLYGNFTTLTRFTEADLERVVTERLSPIYVSIHATDPDVRTALLRNRRGATSLRWLGLLLDAGIEVHGQIVCCPGANDGAVLEHTLVDVLTTYPQLSSIGVVPLGISAHNREPELRVHTRAEAEAVVDLVTEWQSIYRDALGHHLVDVSDEYYLLTDRPVPCADHYGAFVQLENGVGMIAKTHAEVRAALAARHGRARHARAGSGSGAHRARGGFFASVDGAPADGYRAPRVASEVGGVADGGGAVAVELRPRPREDAPVRIVTGEYGAGALSPVVDELSSATGRDVQLEPVRNAYFGGNIAVTGLLTGVDLARALERVPAAARVLVPDVALSRGRFLDGMTVAELPRTIEVVATDGASLVDACAR